MSGAQPELKGMPAKTKATMRAEEVVEAMEALEDKKTQLDARKESLVQQMKAENQMKVICLSAAGVKHRFRIEELEKLTVKKDK